MIHKLLAGHRSHMRRVLSIMLCLALVCGTVASINVFASETQTESESETTTEEEAAAAEASEETSAPEETGAPESSTETSEGTAATEETETKDTESEAQTATEAEETTAESTEIESESDETESEISTKALTSTLSEESSVSATADDGISLTAISGDTTVAVGKSITLTGSTGNSNSWSYTSDNGGAVSFGDTNNSSVTVTGVTEGTVTITHSYRSGRNNYTETYEVTVTAASTIVTVYVFVAGYDYDTGEYFSQDMLELLNVNTLDSYGYFAAGTLELDLSYLSGTTTSMITSDEEWAYVLAQLASNLETSTSETCPDNLIASYASQVLTDTGVTQNQGYSGLWLAGGHSNITEVSGSAVNGQYWHLDIRFQTVKITYIYGENGITTSNSSVAYDGNTAGSKVFIQGATMNYTPTIEAPDGWKIVGYYTTSDFQEGTEWNAVGQPINEDTTVYIKIVPEGDVVINYVVAEGSGTVTNPSYDNQPAQSGYESFNPTTGAVTGSTAEASEGWTFEGWYYDASCTQPVPDDWVDANGKITPQPDGDKWAEDETHTYYAKFVPVKTTVTVIKVWEDNENTSLRPSSVTVELYAGDEATGTTAEITRDDGWTYTFTDLNKYSYSDNGSVSAEIEYKVQENEVDGYTSKVTTGTDGTITVTNTLSTAIVTLTKVVAGNMGVKSNKFEFTVTYTDANGDVQTDNPRLTGETGSNTATYEVKLGTKVTVTETQEGLYVMSATVDGATETVSNNTVTVTVNGNSDIVVTNTYNATPDTGINLDSAPYIAILFGVALFGTVALISRRRRLL